MTLNLTMLRCPERVPLGTRQIEGGEFSIGRAPDKPNECRTGSGIYRSKQSDPRPKCNSFYRRQVISRNIPRAWSSARRRLAA